jgi:DNA-binding XRE family transcriptional regulator
MASWPRYEPWRPDRLRTFGGCLRRGRHCAGLSQQRLADLAGVSQTLVSRLERGRAPHVSLSRVLAIQHVLGACLPLGICPHEHDCLWRPRSTADHDFLRGPGDPARREN